MAAFSDDGEAQCLHFPLLRRFGKLQVPPFKQRCSQSWSMDPKESQLRDVGRDTGGRREEVGMISPFCTDLEKAAPPLRIFMSFPCTFTVEAKGAVLYLAAGGPDAAALHRVQGLWAEQPLVKHVAG